MKQLLQLDYIATFLDSMNRGSLIVLTFFTLDMIKRWRYSIVFPSQIMKFHYLKILPIFDKLMVLNNKKNEAACRLITL